MSGHDHESPQAAPREHVEAPKGGPTASTAEVRRPDAAETWSKIEKIIGGHSKAAHDLPRLVSLLDADRKTTFSSDHFASLGANVSGDVVIQTGEVLELHPTLVVETALAAKAPPTKRELRRFLSKLRGSDANELAPDVIKGLRKVMTGPLLEELPIASEWIWALSGHAELLTWFIDTTRPSIVALKFAQAGSAELATTIEALATTKKWEWVDHVHLAQGFDGLRYIAAAAPDQIKKKLEAKLGPISDEREAKKFREQHAGDVSEALDGKPTLRELIDAVARVGRVEGENATKVLAALKKLEPSADDVVAIAPMIGITGEVILELLVGAKGVTSQHVSSYLMLYGIEHFSTTTSSSLVKRLRRHMPELRFRELIEAGGGGGLKLLLANASLRDWFFDTATPEDLLWFCGSSAESASACKLMDRRDPSWRWVKDLTAAGETRQLRAVALNCGHAPTVQHIRQVLLAEPAPRQETIATAETPNWETKGGATGRVLDAIAEGGDVLARVADLDEAQRARHGQLDTFVEHIGKHLTGADFARAAVLLDLTFARVVANALSPSPALVAYLRTRPRAEEIDTAGKAPLVERALTHVHPDPLVVFPSLRDPVQLAKALEHNPKLIKTLFRHGEPSTVADLLSREPVLSITEKMLDKSPELLSSLPHYRQLTKRGKEGVDRLAKHAHGDTVQELEDVRTNDHDPRDSAREEGAKLHGAVKHDSVWKALDELVAKGGSAQSALALLGEYSGDQVRALLSDQAHSSQVHALAKLTELPAHVVFPQLSVESLLSMRNARAWLFDYDHTYVLLDLIAKRPAAIQKVAAELDQGSGANALIWLNRIPVGAALTDGEVRVLDQLQPAIKDASILRTLFNQRFGIVPPAGYDATELASLYRVMCRLPRSHLQQQRIKDIVERPGRDGTAGSWSGETITLSPDLKEGAESETYHSTSKRYSKAQITRLYGWNDVELAQQVKQGNVRYSVGSDQYELVAEKADKFTTTVLHEIGHSIDDILGERTEPVYGIAQWRSYAAGDFDNWAAEMGGWDKVTPSDQKQIREAWVDALRAKTKVGDLVGSDHPALASRYEHVGIVAKAREKTSFNYASPVTIGDRTFVMNTYYQRFFSVSATAAETKPSAYSLYAPQEYFAEAYVEYYREVDGTPGSRGKKGGALPGPVKNWFTNNVDTLKYDPQRFEKQDDSDAGGE
jgi:hypothetical protein